MKKAHISSAVRDIVSSSCAARQGTIFSLTPSLVARSLDEQDEQQNHTQTHTVATLFLFVSLTHSDTTCNDNDDGRAIF